MEIAYSDQKFWDWDLKLLQATQHQGSHDQWFLKSPVVAALKRWFQHGVGGAVVIIAIRYLATLTNFWQHCKCNGNSTSDFTIFGSENSQNFSQIVKSKTDNFTGEFGVIMIHLMMELEGKEEIRANLWGDEKGVGVGNIIFSY